MQVGSDKLVYGLGPLYVAKSDASTLTFARDGGKSVRAELNGTGGVTASFRYRAYGDVVQSNGATAPSYLGYAGQLRDSSGLYYLRARWYDPASARFVNRDPLEGRAERPTELNGFGYAGGQPINRIDPTGMCAIDDGGLASVQSACGGGGWGGPSLASIGPAFIGAIVAAIGSALIWDATSDTNKQSATLGDSSNFAHPNPNDDEDERRIRATWGNRATLRDHFERHGADFGALNEAQYADMAAAFRARALAEQLPAKVTRNGVLRVYDPATDTFGAYNANGTTRTFFKPDPRIHLHPSNWDFWLGQAGRSPW